MTRRAPSRRGGSRRRGAGTPVVRGRMLAWLGLALGVAAAVGIAYVWLANETYRFGYRIDRMRGELESWRDTNMQLQTRIYTLESPGQLMRRVREFNLALGVPDEAHTVLVWEPVDNVIEDEQTRLAELR